MTPRLLLRCGCEIRFRDGEAPICPAHGLQVIVRVLAMPPPRFRGLASGPHVETVDLGAFTGRIAGSDQVTHGD